MGYMQTHAGLRFYPENVPASQFCIEDIAHALSNLCRFGGHSKRFYSVAQHSVLVADIVRANGGSIDEELWALMHDSAEAYMVDVPTPVKVLLKGYKEKENEVIAAIQLALSLPELADGDLPAIIKEADGIALVTEAQTLVTGCVKDWEAYKYFKPRQYRLGSYGPNKARKEFMNRWHDIQRRRSRKTRRTK